MEYVFSAHEIVDLAIQIEEEGIKFYTTLSSISSNKTLKDVFKFLAEQEIEHKNILNNIAKEIEVDDKLHTYSIDICKLMLTAIEMLRSSAFENFDLDNSPQNIKVIIELAISIEEKSIQVYTQMQKNFIDRFEETFLKIISEEEKHLKLLKNVEKDMNF